MFVNCLIIYPYRSYKSNCINILIWQKDRLTNLIKNMIIAFEYNVAAWGYQKTVFVNLAAKML